MSNYNLIDDFPETFIYNNFNYDLVKEENKNQNQNRRINIDIDHVVFELLQCNKNKEKFELIMEGLEREILGDEKLSDTEDNEQIYQNSQPKTFSRQITANSNYNNRNNDEKQDYTKKHSGSEFSLISDVNSNPLASKRTFEIENKFSRSKTGFISEGEKSILETNRTQFSNNNKNFAQPNNLNKNNVPMHKKYTDVHANTKYYYPSDYQNNFETDLDLEPSQWTDRANRSTIYNNSVVHNNSFMNTTFHNDESYMGGSPNRFVKDNMNSNMLNRNTNKNMTRLNGKFDNSFY